MVPPVAQSESLLCGPASTAGVLLYHDVPYETVAAAFAKLGDARAEWSAADIVAVAEAAGLEAYFYRGSLDDALSNVQAGRPLLVLLNGPPRTASYPSLKWFSETGNMLVAKAHWVAVIGWRTEQDIVLIDPLKGYLVMNRREFLSEWRRTGYVCVLTAPILEAPKPTGGA